MSQSLIINGKEYVQSSVLTTLYKYTPDYIGKLAREEKIIGTQVGRQWYIEPESLKIFLHKTAIEKEIRAEELSLKRKVEHQAFQATQHFSKTKVPTPHVALAQVLVIIGCGAITGLLGWNALSSDLTLRDITFSVKESTSLIAQTFSPVQALQSFTATSDSSLKRIKNEAHTEVSYEDENNSNFVSPQESKNVPLNSESSIQQQFSDEVFVTTDTDGSVFVQPVFKEENTVEPLYKVIPIVSSGL